MTDRQAVTSAWAFHTSGSHLSDDERACLEHALQNDDACARELADDHQLHRMLVALGTIDKTKEDFVIDVLARCSGNDDVTLSQSQSETNPVPVDRPVVASVPVRRRTARALLRHPIVLLPFAGTLVLALLLLVLLDRYRTVEQRFLAAERRVQEQRTEFEARLTAERNRPLDFPVLPVLESAKSHSPPSTTAQPIVDQQPANPVTPAVARLADAGNAVWTVTPDDANFSAGRWELQQGQALLKMSGGSQIGLTAPTSIELINSHHVLLHQGTLTASVPADEIGFRVSTPNARIIDLGTEFRVSVDESGETDVEVERGEVVLVPWDGNAGGRRWHLVAGELDHAKVSPSAGPGHDVLVSEVSGPAGFQGQIRLAGVAMDLASQDHFDRLQAGVTAQFAASPEEAIRNWRELAETVNATSGSVTLDGKVLPFSGLDGVLNFEDLLLNRDDVPSMQNSVFAGKVNINGQERSFQNREEYEAFRREMFESLRGFGIPGPAQLQLELDKQQNPFQP